jgi:hypothetical protein
LQDGSLPRFLVFRTADDMPDRNRDPAPLCDIPAELLAAIEAVAAVGADRSRGNLADTGASVVKPDPQVVAMDDDARAVFDELDAEMTLRQRAAVGTERSAVLARVWENTAKVALIKAVSADPDNPVTRGVDAQWARELVEHCVATLIAEAARHLADNDIERHHKRALEFVRLAGPDGIARRDLTRKLQFIEPRLREDVIRTFIESEQIVALVRNRWGGRPPTASMCQGSGC